MTLSPVEHCLRTLHLVAEADRIRYPDCTAAVVLEQLGWLLHEAGHAARYHDIRVSNYPIQKVSKGTLPGCKVLDYRLLEIDHQWLGFPTQFSEVMGPPPWEVWWAAGEDAAIEGVYAHLRQKYPGMGNAWHHRIDSEETTPCPSHLAPILLSPPWSQALYQAWRQVAVEHVASVLEEACPAGLVPAPTLRMRL